MNLLENSQSRRHLVNTWPLCPSLLWRIIQILNGNLFGSIRYDINRDIRCPRAGCGNAVKSDIKSISEAECSCGFKFW